MSILIKGVEMPTNCFGCPCYHHKRDDGYYDYEICRASGTVFNDGYSSVTGHKDHINPFEARLDNCPLIPIPPHGRLIDADAFLALVNDTTILSDVVKYIINPLIMGEPTVVEAEEDE